MAGIRVTIDMFFPMPLSDTAQASWDALKAEINKARDHAVKVNEGKDNEEMTVKATYHVCHHDTGQPCEPEQDV